MSIIVNNWNSVDIIQQIFVYKNQLNSVNKIKLLLWEGVKNDHAFLDNKYKELATQFSSYLRVLSYEKWQLLLQK